MWQQRNTSTKLTFLGERAFSPRWLHDSHDGILMMTFDDFVSLSPHWVTFHWGGYLAEKGRWRNCQANMIKPLLARYVSKWSFGQSCYCNNNKINDDIVTFSLGVFRTPSLFLDFSWTKLCSWFYSCSLHLLHT